MQIMKAGRLIEENTLLLLLGLLTSLAVPPLLDAPWTWTRAVLVVGMGQWKGGMHWEESKRV